MLLSMHAPDGFLQPGVAAVTAVIAAVVLSVSLRVSSAELGDRRTPLAGLAAAFVFAAQMVNFPVASGTSGHLLGGALAAILLGPWVGALVVSVVVVVQALLFADGGLTALGYNIVNMAIVPAFGGWAAFQLARRVLPRNASGVVAATGLAAGLSVVLASAAFSLEWLFGASAPVAFDTVFGAMVGVHLLIGVGEALASAAVVGAVLAARADLVTGAGDLSPDQLRDRPGVGVRPFVIAGGLVTLTIASVVSQFAADGPDGLERVAIDQGFADRGGEHLLGAAPFAGYATQGISNEALSLTVAGVVGTILTLLVGYGLLTASRRTGTTGG